jgi:hypothetical protein
MGLEGREERIESREQGGEERVVLIVSKRKLFSHLL